MSDASPPAVPFACPVCTEPLTRNDGALRCPNGHSFDIAREGYVNLLLPQHRRSKDPGDSHDMIAARRAFLEAGHYAPVAERIAGAVARVVPAKGTVIDAGCGEGYYLRQVRAAASGETAAGVQFCGIDISKHGVRLAARRDPAGHYAVASSYRLPFPAASADVIISHFSPVSAAEFARVLKPGGHTVIGGPAEHHLFALKSLIYTAPAKHETLHPALPAETFQVSAETRVRYALRLVDPAHIGALFAMTPFYWSARPEVQAAIAAMPVLETEIDITVAVYAKRPPPPVP